MPGDRSFDTPSSNPGITPEDVRTSGYTRPKCRGLLTRRDGFAGVFQSKKPPDPALGIRWLTNVGYLFIGGSTTLQSNAPCVFHIPGGHGLKQRPYRQARERLYQLNGFRWPHQVSKRRLAVGQCPPCLVNRHLFGPARLRKAQ